LEFFKSTFGVFWHFSVLNLAFSGHWHLIGNADWRTRRTQLTVDD
jgi:hypothetical protein